MHSTLDNLDMFKQIAEADSSLNLSVGQKVRFLGFLSDDFKYPTIKPGCLCEVTSVRPPGYYGPHYYVKIVEHGVTFCCQEGEIERVTDNEPI